jgi:plasmid stabilization system protein ParE
MTSGYKVVWSEEANKNLEQIIDYLEKEWTEKEIGNFFGKLEKTITLISKKPNLFRITNKRKNIHKCVLIKQVSIYYKHSKDTVYIISLFDNRQHPSKLKT